MMLALLGKDWRVNRVAVVGGAFVAVCPYAVLLWSQVWYPPTGGNTTATYLRAVEHAAAVGMVLSLVMAAVFGAIAFAAERRDRSSEFIAMLPVRRGPIVLSKLLVAVACVAVLFAVHTTVYVLTMRHAQVPNWAVPSRPVMIVLLLLYFAIAWTLSLYLQSPGLAAAVAIGVGTVLYFLAVIRAERAVTAQHWSREDASFTVTMFCLAVALVAFAVSTAHYLRRVRV